MKKTSIFCCLAIASFTRICSADFHLKSGDRVVFYGDSITDQRLYTTFVETYVVTRFPKLPLTFVHSGWGGDRVTGGGGGPIDHRLKRDVIAYNPTVMTIMLGMNDGSYRPFDQGIFDTYSNGYRKIIKDMKAAVPGLRFTVIQPSPFDDVTRAPSWTPGYNDVLLKYGAFLQDLARQETLGFADLNTDVVNALKVADKTDHVGAQKIVADRVHPGPGGHLLMAECLLKAWDAPAVVSSINIQTGNTVNVTTVNCTATVTANKDHLSWKQLDNALPMPVDMNDAPTALSVRSSDFVKALNQQLLSVKGLKSGSYSLKIDGEEVGSFSSDQLAQGVNLAELNTPMMKQAAAVHVLTIKHNNVHFQRWRSVQVPFEKDEAPSMVKALTGLDALEMDYVKKQRAAAQPKTHTFELSPK